MNKQTTKRLNQLLSMDGNELTMILGKLLGYTKLKNWSKIELKPNRWGGWPKRPRRGVWGVSPEYGSSHPATMPQWTSCIDSVLRSIRNVCRESVANSILVYVLCVTRRDTKIKDISESIPKTLVYSTGKHWTIALILCLEGNRLD